MHVGAFVPCRHMLSQFLGGVIKSLLSADDILILNRNFNETPEEEVRNSALQRLSGCDWVWMLDSDEIITPSDQFKILQLVDNTDYDVVFCPIIDYSAVFGKIYEMRDHKPAVLVRPSVRFYNNRCLHFRKQLSLDSIFVHHFGYALNDSTQKWKTSNWWDKHNPNELQVNMSRPLVDYVAPDDVQEFLCV